MFDENGYYIYVDDIKVERFLQPSFLLLLLIYVSCDTYRLICLETITITNLELQLLLEQLLIQMDSQVQRTLALMVPQILQFLILPQQQVFTLVRLLLLLTVVMHLLLLLELLAAL